MSDDNNDLVKDALNDDGVTNASPQERDEEELDGHMPNPEIVNSRDALDEAQSNGLAEDADEEHPKELNMAQDIENAEQRHLTDE